MGLKGCLAGISGHSSRIHAGFEIPYGIMGSLADLPEAKHETMGTQTTGYDVRSGNARVYR
jgi:hypothetical protein